MFQRLILGALLLLIPSIRSSENVEAELFDAQFQRVERSSLSEDYEEGSGLEEEGGSGSEEMTDCSDWMFGCCPNSSLPAHGPHQTGCCLEGAEAECCPDFQRSRGPGQDCACQDSIFGCCPDGVTAKWSEDDGGCGCRHTTFGCCQDQVTTAQGEISHLGIPHG